MAKKKLSKKNKTLLLTIGAAAVGVGFIMAKAFGKKDESNLAGIGAVSKQQRLQDIIVADILKNYDSIAETKSELKRYKETFRREPDYNYVQYGNLLVSPYEIKELLAKIGYKAGNYSNDRVWRDYQVATRSAIDYILQNY